jgi:futalosine hydrolase
VGRLGERTLTLLETGIGITNTTQALTVAIHDALPEIVIQIGVGGAYLSSPLKVHDLAIATSESYGNLGVITPDGWQSAKEIGIPLLHTDQDYYNTFPLDTELASRADSIIQSECPDIVRRSGPFVTVEQCSGLSSTGNELAERFSAICENMEGAAAAHICTLYSIPFLEVRGISNVVENRDKKNWDLPGASLTAQSAAIALAKNWH